jgi:hypothetical protein
LPRSSQPEPGADESRGDNQEKHDLGLGEDHGAVRSFHKGDHCGGYEGAGQFLSRGHVGPGLDGRTQQRPRHGGPDPVGRQGGRGQHRRQRHTAASQPLPQQPAGAAEAVADRGLAPAQPDGHLGAALVFQAAEDKRLAVGLGQAGDLLVQDGLDLLPLGAEAGGGGPRPCLLFVFAPPGGGPSCLGSHAGCHSMKPAGQRLALANGGGPPCQEQEGGLEGVLGVLLVAEPAAAQVEDHGPVPPQHRLEGRLVVVAQEGADQFAVGPLVGGPVGGQVADVAEDRSQCCRGHRLRSLPGLSIPLL